MPSRVPKIPPSKLKQNTGRIEQERFLETGTRQFEALVQAAILVQRIDRIYGEWEEHFDEETARMARDVLANLTHEP